MIPDGGIEKELTGDQSSQAWTQGDELILAEETVGRLRLCSAMSPKVEERNDLVAFHLVGLSHNQQPPPRATKSWHASLLGNVA